MPFKNLDALLKEEFDNINKTPHNSKNTNPFFISTETICEELENGSSYDFTLPALQSLSTKLHLNDFEKDVLMIIFAPEINPKYERIYAYLQDDMNKKYPTIHLIASILSKNQQQRKEILEYFITDSKLLMFDLINFSKHVESTSIFNKALSLTPSLRNYLLNNFNLDSTLSSFCSIYAPLPSSKPSNQILINKLEAGLNKQERYLFNLQGISSIQKHNFALELASHFNFGLLVVISSHIPSQLPTQTLLNILMRDSILAGAILYFENFESFLQDRKKDEQEIFSKLQTLSWISFFSTKKAWIPTKTSTDPLFIPIPFKEESKEVLREQWRNMLYAFDKELAYSVSKELANLFKFTQEEINNVSKHLRAQSFLEESINKEMIFTACRARLGDDLDAYAQKLQTPHTIKDIVLPPEYEDQLHEIISHYKHQTSVFEKAGFKQHFQSQGIGILFAGSSGTGKTMAASIISNTLGLTLYRVELSKIVSKYVGETEKHLDKIFHAAQKLGVVLFFDEADTLFSKRVDTKSSNDRYSNGEVSYLLQRMESYEGIIILASNFRNNIDEAFIRRMRFIIDFPLPSEYQREMIWKKMLPTELCTQPLEYTHLAKYFKLSGANIRNAALFSAFNATEDSTKIEMRHVLKGIKRELQKIGKPFKEIELEVK